MTIKDKFQQGDWENQWAGKWVITSFTDWGRFYCRTPFSKEFEKFVDRIMVVWEGGVAQAYLKHEEKERFSKAVIEKGTKDETLFQFICKSLKQSTDNYLQLDERYKGKELTFDEFEEYRTSILDYYSYHIPIKVAIDFLPQEMLDKYMEMFEEARVYAEPVFSKNIEFMNELAKVYAEKTGYSPSAISAMTDEEFSIFLKSDILPNKDILEERSEQSVFLFYQKEMEILVGNSAKFSQEVLKSEENLEWSKEWTGAYSILSSSYDGLLMAQTVKDFFGSSYQNCAIICKNGQATGYVSAENVDKFGNYLAEKIKEDVHLADIWVNKIITQAGLFLEESKDADANIDQYLKLRKIFTKYASYHAVIKRVVDFLPKDILEKIIPSFTKARVETEDIYPKAEEIFKKFYSDICDKSGYSMGEVLSLTQTELEKYFEDNKLPSKELLAQRIEGCVLLFQQGNLEILTGGEFTKFEQSINSPAGLKNVKGFKAFGGVAKGKARVILDPESVSDFKEGEILITGMTRPEYLQLVRKSAAFVTDAGGVLSHAAITARELQKPCVIGTKNATKIFNDGDIVEVNADKGTVTLCENSEEGADLSKEELKAKVLEYGDWEPWLSREFGAFILSLFIGGNSRQAMQKIGVDVEHKAVLCEYTLYASKKAFEEMFEDIEKEIAKGLTIKKVSESCEKFRDNSKARLIALLKNSSMSNRDKFIEAIEIIKPVISYIWLAHDLEYYYTPIFKEKFAKYFEGDIDKIIGDLSFPVKKNSHVLLEEALLGETDIKEIVDEFGWINARDGFRNPYTEEELIELREKLKSEEKKEPPKIDVPLGIMHEVAESREIVYFRTLRTDTMFELLFIARPIIRAIGEEYGIEFSKMKNYSIYDLIDGKPVEYPESLICAYYKDQAYFYDEPILPKKEVEHEQIKGSVAFSGKVTGTAKVVNKFEEIGKVEEGDILVTHMTVPSFVMAMKKAAGFVTNEGGMTCHAAIIAREMKKPCITGTKIATKLIKDGDIIEVDAEQGVVRLVHETQDES